MNSLKILYEEKIRKKLQNQYSYSNPHQIPKLVKIQVSSGLGLNAQNKNYLHQAVNELKQISGQHPVITKAKQSVAGFKIREGMPLGIFVTLRREKMFSFLEKVIKLVLPRIRDFRGLSPYQFDKFGNYHFGISDQLVFPEIDYDSVDKKRGFTISIVTTATNNSEAYTLLSELGFPFSRDVN